MCTNFSLSTKNEHQIIGRTMELGFNLESKLFFRPAGYQYDQNVQKELIEKNLELFEENFELSKEITKETKPYHWEGEYGFVAMNGLGADIATDGMNTEGLTTGTMVLALSDYQPLTPEVLESEDFIYYFNLTNWILSNCKDTDDILKKLSVDEWVVDGVPQEREGLKKGLKVVTPFKKVPPAMQFHFPVHDARGFNFVLEYVNGRLIMSDMGPTNVLTNDPVISWQQTNVTNNYVGVSPFNYQKSQLDKINAQIANNFVCESAAQGTGFGEVPGSSTPVDRFVRAAMMVNFCYQPEDEIEGTTLAFHIINTVDIPKGTSRELPEVEKGEEVDYNDREKIISDYTQWSTVSDLQNLTYTIRMYDSPQVFRVNLKDLDLKALEDVHKELPVEDQFVDITASIVDKES